MRNNAILRGCFSISGMFMGLFIMFLCGIELPIEWLVIYSFSFSFLLCFVYDLLTKNCD